MRWDPNYRIGIVPHLTPAYPRSQHSEDGAARISRAFQAKSFLDPSVLGHYLEAISGDPIGSVTSWVDYDPSGA